MPRVKPWHLAFAMLCAAWWLRKLVWSNPGNQWDFRVYYFAAQAWRAGLDPYDPAVSLPAHGVESYAFLYPPYTLGFFALFTALPLRHALVAFLTVKLVLLASLVAVWGRLLKIRVTEPTWVVFLVFAYSSCIYVDFSSGNVTVFEQWLLWIGVASLLARRYWAYSAAVVGASLFKLTPIVLLAVLVIVPDRRRYHYLSYGALAFAAIFLVTYAVSPQETVRFFQSISSLDERGRVNPASLALVRDASALFNTAWGPRVTPDLQTWLYALLAATILVPTLIVVRRVANTGAVNRVEVSVYLVLLAYALVLPRFKNYSYMLLIVPTYYIAIRSTRLRQAIPLLLIACLPIYSWITREDNITLLANYASWLIALGAWALYLHEIRCGALLRVEAA
jgi:hypothetical protein